MTTVYIHKTEVSSLIYGYLKQRYGVLKMYNFFGPPCILAYSVSLTAQSCIKSRLDHIRIPIHSCHHAHLVHTLSQQRFTTITIHNSHHFLSSLLA